jgi:hypothetical protein
MWEGLEQVRRHRAVDNKNVGSTVVPLLGLNRHVDAVTSLSAAPRTDPARSPFGCVSAAPSTTTARYVRRYDVNVEAADIDTR